MERKTEQQQPPAYGLLVEFLERALPGASARIIRYRRELLDFAATPTERALFLTSAGAEYMAAGRLAALLRTAMLLKPEAAGRILEGTQLALGGLAHYRQLAGGFSELDATAMREADALKELLGGAAPAFARPGVFERAMLLNGRPTNAAALTGGIVHVAEPASLSASLQGLLANIVAGASFSRIGPSEEEEEFLAFEGVVICSTAQLRAADGLRPDVVKRLVGREIAVPRLSELMPDFSTQVGAALSQIRREYGRFHDRAKLSTDAARDFWLRFRPPQQLPAKVRDQLAKVDWARSGESAGLLSVVRAIVAGTPPSAAIAGLAPAAVPSRSDPTEILLGRLEALECEGGTMLAGRLRLLENETRSALKLRLRGDAAATARLARKLGISVKEFNDQLAQLDRVRPAKRGSKG